MFFPLMISIGGLKGKNIDHRTLVQLYNPFPIEETETWRGDGIVQSVTGSMIVIMRHRAISPTSFFNVTFSG